MESSFVSTNWLPCCLILSSFTSSFLLVLPQVPNDTLYVWARHTLYFRKEGRKFDNLHRLVVCAGLFIPYGMQCASCGAPASQTCANCGTTAYCCKEHQRGHWPKHRADCSPCKVCHNSTLGRFLSAARSVEAGSLLIREYPLVVGPCAWSPSLCLGCHCELQQNVGCSACGAPVCQASCQDLAVHRLGECRALVPNKGAGLPAHMAAVLPLRCLLGLRGLAPQWQGFLQLEAHLEKRRGTAVWREQQTHVVEVLRELGLIAADGSEDELVQRICAILDVNSFEVRGPGAGQLRAVYLRTALLAHDCVPNVLLAVDDGLQITVKASRAVEKGETLFYNYCAVLQNTAARRERLREGKYFECQCRRCSDPTELGSHLSSLWCVRCRGGLVVPPSPSPPPLGVAPVPAPRWLERRLAALRPLPEALRNFRSHSRPRTPGQAEDAWRCLSCGWTLSDRAARSTLARAQDLWEAADKQDARALEGLVRHLGGCLAPTHALLLDVKQVLVALYRDEARPSSAHQARAVELCEELLAVLDALEPGSISRLKGIALHEMHVALILGGDEQRLERAREHLHAAIRHLRHEPSDSPEGGLCALALQELSALTSQLASLHVQPARGKTNKMKRS